MNIDNYTHELQALIVIGGHPSAIKGGADGLNRGLSSLLNDTINRQAPAFWRKICANLNIEHHVALFRGLVIAERELDWLGGSVSGAIWVFRGLRERISESRYAELLNWSLRNRGSNPYVPLGTMRFARSTQELEQEQHDIESRRARRREEHYERMKSQANQKRARRLAAKEHDAAAAAKREQRATAIRALEVMKPEERFVWLVRQQQWAPAAMPPALFPRDQTITSVLSNAEKASLAARLRSARGHWAELREILESESSQSLANRRSPDRAK
jgi:hypothetical protein